MSQRGDDAQREREEGALRKVRAVLDEVETDERTRNTRALKSVLWIAPIAIVLLAAGAFFLPPKKPSKETRTMEPQFASYVESCLSKIVRLANSSYKSEMAGVSGQAELTMAVRFDGIIEGVEVHKSSGHEAIEPTAKRLVRMADTCGAFPEEIRKDADVLQIRRTFELGQGGVTQR